MTYTVTISMTDEPGRKGRMSINLPASWDFATVTAYTQAFLGLLEPLHKGAVTGVTVTQDIALPGGLRAAPLPGSDTLEKMRIQFRTEFNRSTAYYIPCFDESYAATVYGEAYRILDLLVNDAYDFLQLQINATGAGYPSNISDKRGELVTDVRRTKQTFFRSKIPYYKDYS